MLAILSDCVPCSSACSTSVRVSCCYSCRCWSSSSSKVELVLELFDRLVFLIDPRNAVHGEKRQVGRERGAKNRSGSQ